MSAPPYEKNKKKKKSFIFAKEDGNKTELESLILSRFQFCPSFQMIYQNYLSLPITVTSSFFYIMDNFLWYQHFACFLIVNYRLLSDIMCSTVNWIHFNLIKFHNGIFLYQWGVEKSQCCKNRRRRRRMMMTKSKVKQSGMTKIIRKQKRIGEKKQTKKKNSK